MYAGSAGICTIHVQPNARNRSEELLPSFVKLLVCYVLQPKRPNEREGDSLSSCSLRAGNEGDKVFIGDTKKKWQRSVTSICISYLLVYEYTRLHPYDHLPRAGMQGPMSTMRFIIQYDKMPA